MRQHDVHWRGEGEPLFNERGPDWDDTWEIGENTDYGVAEVPFIRRGDSAYVIVEGPTWEEAEANANKLGGHLVTINDAEENQWLVDNFASKISYNGRIGDESGEAAYTPRAWIGLNDKDEEGDYKWSSGEELTYFEPSHDHQMTGLRDTYTGLYAGDTPKTQFIDQDYVSIQLGENTESDDWNPGYWEDSWNDHYQYEQGIAEITITSGEDNYESYLIKLDPDGNEISMLPKCFSSALRKEKHMPYKNYLSNTLKHSLKFDR